MVERVWFELVLALVMFLGRDSGRPDRPDPKKNKLTQLDPKNYEFNFDPTRKSLTRPEKEPDPHITSWNVQVKLELNGFNSTQECGSNLSHKLYW